MTGPSLAPLIIPIVGTFFLTAWLSLVFYADRHPRSAAGNPAAGRDDRPSAMTALRARHSRLQRERDLRAMLEVER